ncbi:hypothetical protein PVAP13_9KG414700 [Panicum virgatum]|uniref:Uncharacterized protein n=1 Tax=Panicum virgatum TaxID=38727 RepID=A0A8T0NQA5_PANVG|nr:hypothetical protein PVAP13_9KG414700 [Panicum virgatum]
MSAALPLFQASVPTNGPQSQSQSHMSISNFVCQAPHPHPHLPPEREWGGRNKQTVSAENTKTTHVIREGSGAFGFGGQSRGQATSQKAVRTWQAASCGHVVPARHGQSDRSNRVTPVRRANEKRGWVSTEKKSNHLAFATTASCPSTPPLVAQPMSRQGSVSRKSHAASERSAPPLPGFRPYKWDPVGVAHVNSRFCLPSPHPHPHLPPEREGGRKTWVPHVSDLMSPKISQCDVTESASEK